MSKLTFKQKSTAIEPPLVAPLGTPARRRGPRIAPVARRFLWGGLIIAVGLRLGAIAVEPIRAGYHAGREIRVLEKEYRQVHGRNEHLQRLIRHLQTPAGLEEEARRLGYVRTGERALRIIPETPGLNAGLVATPAAGVQSPGDGASVPGYSDSARHPATPPAASPTPRPRSNTAEKIQQFLATWSATRWVGEMLGGERRPGTP